MKTRWTRLASRESLLTVLLLLATVALLYGHTLSVPMYLDDHGALLGNYRLRDLPATFLQLFSQRGLTNLTFALNFYFTGWALAPLHLTNIALHALCGLLVWLLLRQLLPGRWLPLCGALLFVAHPLQTQAVTYLVQRSAVLAGCFFVATLLCHRQARNALAAGAARRSIPYLKWQVAAVICGAAAVLAKENTAILPLLLLVHDLLFPLPPQRDGRQFFADYLPFCVVPLLLGVPMFLALLGNGHLPRMNSPLVAMAHNDSLHYLVTQFSVLWIYLRLLVLPYRQALEYDYPIAAELLTWQSAAAFLGLVALGILVWRLRRRRPLLAFGAVWFFLALAVESSVIPLDPLFEHRLYLPMFGFILILLDGVPTLFGERRAWAVLGITLLIWMPLTWRRNALWNDTLHFNEQNLGVAPQSERVHLALIFDYRDAGRTADAERYARALLRLNPQSVMAYQELALLHEANGEVAQALAVVEEGLGRVPGDPGLYRTGSLISMRAQQPQAAMAFLQRGIAAAPENPAMYDQRAALQFELGELDAAETSYRESLERNAAVAGTRRNLAKVLFTQGRMAEAAQELWRALQLEPGHPDAWEGLGMSALALGDRETAATAAARLERIDGEGAQRLRAALTAAGPH